LRLLKGSNKGLSANRVIALRLLKGTPSIPYRRARGRPVLLRVAVVTGPLKGDSSLLLELLEPV
jgi:hypothetical protein